MNIIEAIKSGKKFRRKSWESQNWMRPIDTKYPSDFHFHFTYLDIVAEDWEIKPTPVTVTREQLDAAWERCLAKQGHAFTNKHLARELGL